MPDFPNCSVRAFTVPISYSVVGRWGKHCFIKKEGISSRRETLGSPVDIRNFIFTPYIFGDSSIYFVIERWLLTMRQPGMRSRCVGGGFGETSFGD